jgi:hypothetical protein
MYALLAQQQQFVKILKLLSPQQLFATLYVFKKGHIQKSCSSTNF